MDMEKMAILADIALNDPSKAAEIFASMGIPVPQPGQQMPGLGQQPLFGGGAPAMPQPQPQLQAAPTQAAAPVVPPGVPPAGQPGLNNLDQILMQAFQPQGVPGPKGGLF